MGGLASSTIEKASEGIGQFPTRPRHRRNRILGWRHIGPFLHRRPSKSFGCRPLASLIALFNDWSVSIREQNAARLVGNRHVAILWEDMMKRFDILGALLIVSGLSIAAPADATTTQRCRNAQGRFIACPPPARSAAGALPAGITRDRNGRCHGAHGRFVACPH